MWLLLGLEWGDLADCGGGLDAVVVLGWGGLEWDVVVVVWPAVGFGMGIVWMAMVVVWDGLVWNGLWWWFGMGWFGIGCGGGLASSGGAVVV